MTHIITNLKNHILVSSRMLEHTVFDHSVVYVCEHNAEGCMGVIINQPVDNLTFDQILADMGINNHNSNQPIIYNGGPVAPNRGFVLHSDEYSSDDTLPIGQGIALSTTTSVVSDIANGVGPQHINFCLGYAGWGQGQLETELSKDCWYALPATPQLVFAVPAPERYAFCLKALGLQHYYGTQGLA